MAILFAAATPVSKINTASAIDAITRTMPYSNSS